MESPRDVFEQGCQLFNGGEYFEAHEAWEALWVGENDAPRRAYLQGLIQVAAALVHAQRGNWRGVRKLAASAMGYLETGKGAALEGEVPVEPLLERVVGLELTLREVEAGHRGPEALFFTLPRG